MQVTVKHKAGEDINVIRAKLKINGKPRIVDEINEGLEAVQELVGFRKESDRVCSNWERRRKTMSSRSELGAKRFAVGWIGNWDRRGSTEGRNSFISLIKIEFVCRRNPHTDVRGAYKDPDINHP
ncbi:hypothetical protein FGB62_17g17 [Gracilaria domingensis]|nr:hypothetical protein FGB62_17g17 [Gracilaria domingensis]